MTFFQLGTARRLLRNKNLKHFPEEFPLCFVHFLERFEETRKAGRRRIRTFGWGGHASWLGTDGGTKIRCHPQLRRAASSSRAQPIPDKSQDVQQAQTLQRIVEILRLDMLRANLRSLLRQRLANLPAFGGPL